MFTYLDYNATAPIRPEVLSCMAAWEGVPLNPSSPHALGKQAKSLIHHARQDVLSSAGGEGADLYFTSGGTESNGLVLNGPWDHIFCSATEHASTYQHPRATKVPVLSSGILDLDALKACLEKTSGQRVLVSVHAANNETGIVQPLEEIVKIAHHYGALVHSDGVQLFGKMPLSFEKTQLDFLSLSSHKVGGPQGVGALVCRKGLALTPLFVGGGQEGKTRPGTENVRAIIGFGEAVKHFDFPHMRKTEETLRGLEARLEDFFSARQIPFFVIGKNEKRLPQTSNLGVSGASNQSQLIYLDLKDVGVSIGSACSSGTVKASHVLTNMAVPEEMRKASLRISAGWRTKEEDFLLFYRVWTSFWADTREKKETVHHEKEINIS